MTPEITLDRKPNCELELRVKLPAQDVKQERDRITRAFQNQARLPGYRPGKIPPQVVQKRFAREIREELKDQLTQTAFREAVKQENLQVLLVEDVAEQDFGMDDTFAFKAMVVVRPEFELPEYKGIPVKMPRTAPTDAEVSQAMEALRGQAAKYDDVTDRGLDMEDFAILDSTGTSGGRPMAEVFEGLPANVASHRDLWVRLAPGVFLPGFCEALLGAKVGEQRVFELDIPEDFVLKQLAGEHVAYEVTIKGIKQQTIPEWDDELAKGFGPETVDQLRDTVKLDLGFRLQSSSRQAMIDQVQQHLVSQVQCELPKDLVANETRRIVDDIVQRSAERGIGEEVLKEREREIVGGAAQNAQARVLARFILVEIARKEGIELTKREFEDGLYDLAQSADQDVAKLRKELEARGVLPLVHEDILRRKTLDWLVDQAQKTELEPGELENLESGQADTGADTTPDAQAVTPTANA